MKYYTFVLLIFILGCKESKPIKINKSNFKQIQYNLHKINFLKADVFLPKNYFRLTSNEYRKELLIKEKDIDRRKNIIKGINQFESILEDKALFIDDTNIYNIISIYRYPNYIPFNKYSAAEYLRYLQNQLSKIEVDYDLLEHKFIKIGKSKIIKIKYKSINGKYFNFKTQYIITTNKKTFGINIINNKNEDYYDLIKKITLK